MATYINAAKAEEKPADLYSIAGMLLYVSCETRRTARAATKAAE
jgi:hypothetical protein